MDFEFRSGNYPEVACDLLAFPLFEGETPRLPALRALNTATRGLVASVLDSGEFKAELHRTCLLHRPTGLKAARLLLIGGGPKDEFTLATLREIAGTVVRAARATGARTAALFRRSELDIDGAAQVAVEGALYGSFDSDIYKTRDRDSRSVERFILVARERLPRNALDGALERGRAVGEATNFARTLVNEPANVLTPAQFAERARDRAADVGLEIEVLERERMEALGMNALLAVSRGSEEPPRLVILRIPGQASRGPLRAFVGKGVTFDSGGISLKPPEKMEEMKADMAGGAAVLGAMLALARLRPPERVIGLIPLVENLPSGRATKPGDVVRSLSGKTIEIINTDAEGRLILADALAYARSLGATHLVDIATLTGACMIALGMINAGMMGTDEATIERLRANVTTTGEKLWQLPLDDSYRKAIRSDIADVKNVGNRWGGAITAGKFLQEFVAGTPWVHMDIAGCDYTTDERPFASKGATGFGVRTLVELALQKTSARK